MWAIFEIVALFCANCGMLWIVWGHREIMGKREGDRPQDPLVTAFRMKALFMLLTAYIWIAFFLRPFAIDLPEWGRPQEFLTQTFWGWFGCFVLGFGLRFWAIRSLGKFFTFELGTRKEHKVIDIGPYRWIRHPSYTGLIMVLVALMAMLSWVVPLLISIFFCIVFFSKRIPDEEKMLLKDLGDDYKAYCKKTWALLPWIF